MGQNNPGYTGAEKTADHSELTCLRVPTTALRDPTGRQDEPRRNPKWGEDTQITEERFGRDSPTEGQKTERDRRRYTDVSPERRQVTIAWGCQSEGEEGEGTNGTYHQGTMYRHTYHEPLPPLCEGEPRPKLPRIDRY